jgi:acetoin utilization deacetylase AcuC-like enzyme
MVGIFQHPLYPYTGAVPKGENMLNLPLAPYTRGAQVRELIEQHWMPALEEFRPQMIFVSAGFDAHRDDELAQLGLVEADYAWITRRIKDVALRHAQGRIVSCLEGGYNLGALARSVAAHLRVLAGLHA